MCCRRGLGCDGNALTHLCAVHSGSTRVFVFNKIKILFPVLCCWAFHKNEEYSPYFLVITHQTQARDDIDGLMQKRRNPITNALEYFFLALCHPYKECHLWVSTVHICTATNREYRIGTVDFVIHSHLLPSLPILILIIEVKLSSHSTLIHPSICH